MILGNTDLYKMSGYQGSGVKMYNPDRSLFVEALDILTESDRFLNECLKDYFMESITESDHVSVYTETTNFKKIVHDVFQFFIDGIRTIYNRFKTLMQKIAYSDNTIKKYEHRLKSFSGEFTVSFNPHLYTISDEIPAMDMNTELFGLWKQLDDKVMSLKKMGTSSERAYALQSMKSDFTVDESYYDRIRQKTLNTTYMITHDAYPDELYNAFRSGGKFRSVKITSGDITTICDRFLNYRDTEKDIEKTKKSIEYDAKNVERNINETLLQDYSRICGVDGTCKDELYHFDKLKMTVLDRVNNICSIYLQAYSAKLDAIKEQAQEDKKILYEAISYINFEERR